MEIIKLEPKMKKRAAEIVSSAFFEYPMLTYYFPDPDHRRRALPWYMEKTLNCALRYGEVHITRDYSGVLFILPPGHTRLTQAEFIRGGFLPVPLVMGRRNYAKSDACEKFVADTQERLMLGRPHYYLWGLVADPKAQQKGVGTALLNFLFQKADPENMPIYLETHEPKNVPYYERFGFKLIHTDTIPEHGLDIWCMLREPQK